MYGNERTVPVADTPRPWRHTRRHRALVRELAQLVRHREPSIRVAASAALGRVLGGAEPDALADRKAFGVLLKAAGGGDAATREAAVAALRDAAARRQENLKDER